MNSITFNDLPKEVYRLKEEILGLKTLITNLGNNINVAPKNKAYLSIKEVAQLTHKSINTLYSLTSKHKIPHYKNGNKLLFMENEVMDWINKNKVKTIQGIDYQVDVLTSKCRVYSITYYN
jgi:excisionase family DNA binding protein